MSLSNLLSMAENGLHPACLRCPWNPRTQKEKPAFGVSCKKHGVDWSQPISAVSVLIAQDPAGTTPEKTGNLCGVCNVVNKTDKSAQNGYALWKAAVSLSDTSQDAKRYMNNHYWTNAIMHGVKEDKRRRVAQRCCEEILLEQINLLSPSVVIVTGRVAYESMFDLGLITNNWDDFKNDFSHQVYTETKSLDSGREITIYCTFHGSSRSVKFYAADFYTDATKELLSQKIELLPEPSIAQRFLRLYPGITPEEKGLRVLLLHWLEIGEAIRHANAIGNLGNQNQKTKAM